MAGSALITRFGSDVAPSMKATSELAAHVKGNMATIAASAVAAGEAGAKSFVRMAMLSTVSVLAIKTAWTAAAAVIAFAIGQAVDAFGEYIKIAERAEKAGVGTRFAQQFSQAMESLKLDAAEAQKALETVANGITERFGEMGSGVEQRMREFLGGDFMPGFESQAMQDFDAAGNTEAKVLAVARAVRELTQRGEEYAALDLAERAFGPAVAGKLRAAEDQLKAIDDVIKKLTDPSPKGIIDDAEIQRAQDLTHRMAAAHATMGNIFKVQISLAAAGANFYDVWVQINEVVAAVLKATDDLLKKLTGFDVPKWLGFLADVAVPGRLLGRLAQGPREGEETATFVRRTLLNEAYPEEQPSGPIPRPGGRGRFNRNGRLNFDNPGDPGNDRKKLDAIEQYIVRLERANEELAVEIGLEGKVGAEREKALAVVRAEAAAKKENRDLTDGERAKVEQLGEAYGVLKGRLADMQQQQKANADAWRQMGDMAVDALSDMKLNAEDARSVLNMLTRDLLRAALTGQGWLAPMLGFAAPASAGPNAVGGLAGIFQSMFTGGAAPGMPTALAPTAAGSFHIGHYADGGFIQPGQWGVVGEHAPELAYGGRSGLTIVPGGAGGGIHVSMAGDVIDARGADPAAIARLEGVIARRDAELPQRVVTAVRQAQSRRAL
jgi:hypothetical protein